MTYLPTPEAATPVQPASTRGEGLALAALIIGIVAFFIAWVPVVGIIVGATAIFLAIAARRRRPSNTRLAIWGLVLGALGTLASLTGTIVLIVLMAAGLDIFNTSGWSSAGPEVPIIEAPSTDAPSTDAPPTDASSDGYQPASSPDADALPGVGAPAQPAAMGTTITGKEWKVEVNSYNADGNELVSQANGDGRAPEPGTHFEVVTYTVTYIGTDSGSALDPDLDLITGSFTTITPLFVFLADEMGDDMLNPGDTRTGSKTFVVPDGEHVILRVTPGIFANESFLSTV